MAKLVIKKTSEKRKAYPADKIHPVESKPSIKSRPYGPSNLRSRQLLEHDLEKFFGTRASEARRRMWRHAWLAVAGTFNSVGQETRALRILWNAWRRDVRMVASLRVLAAARRLPRGCWCRVRGKLTWGRETIS
jgi:hypothetical protein